MTERQLLVIIWKHAYVMYNWLIIIIVRFSISPDFICFEMHVTVVGNISRFSHALFVQDGACIDDDYPQPLTFNTGRHSFLQTLGELRARSTAN